MLLPPFCAAGRGAKGVWAEDGWGREGKADREGWGSGLGVENRGSSSFGTAVESRTVSLSGTSEKEGETEERR